jgi:hypothetical protein
LAVVDFATPRGPFVARAARKLSTVWRSALSPMTTLPDPSPASSAGNCTSWIGLAADSATSLSSEKIAECESMSVRTDCPKIFSSSLRSEKTVPIPIWFLASPRKDCWRAARMRSLSRWR